MINRFHLLLWLSAAVQTAVLALATVGTTRRRLTAAGG